MMNIDVQMECVFLKNIGLTVNMIVLIGQMKSTRLLNQDFHALLCLPFFVMNISVYIINDHVLMVDILVIKPIDIKVFDTS